MSVAVVGPVVNLMDTAGGRPAALFLPILIGSIGLMLAHTLIAPPAVAQISVPAGRFEFAPVPEQVFVAGIGVAVLHAHVEHPLGCFSEDMPKQLQ